MKTKLIKGNFLRTKILQMRPTNITNDYLTKFMSVNTIVPNSVFPKLLSENDTLAELGKNHPSICAKSRKPNCWNNSDAPSLIVSITSIGKRGGV